MPISLSHHDDLVALLSSMTGADGDVFDYNCPEYKTEKLLSQFPFISYISLIKSFKKYCIYISHDAANIIGADPNTMIGADFWVSNLHPLDKPRVIKQISQDIDTGYGMVEYRIKTTEDNSVWIFDQYKLIELDEKRCFVVGNWANVSSFKSTNGVTSDEIDPLTGLLNRKGMELQLNEISRFDHYATQHSLCYIDLDEFKIINNTHGTLAGDELLRQIAKLLKSSLSRRDVLARLHGDNFAILLESCSITHAGVILERIQNAFSEFRYNWQGHSLIISSSIGVIPIDNQNLNDADEMLIVAENACQMAKEKGRNRIEIISDQDKHTVLSKKKQEMEWVERINRAFEEDRFYLYYQPIVSLNPEQGEKHYELLIRMKDEDGALVPPGFFLPAVEKYHLSSKVDQWVIKTAFSWLEAYSDILKDNDSWGINLSGQSLANENLSDFVVKQFEHKNIPYSQVYFEVTETSAIANLENAVEFINTLHTKGAKAALDDFGSGLSSFAYLKNLPVDYIKIDGIFIKNILENKLDLSMVKAIRSISIAMGKKTIAEYVENDEIKNELQKIGIDFGQGYGIGKPRSLAEFTKAESP